MKQDCGSAKHETIRVTGGSDVLVPKPILNIIGEKGYTMQELFKASRRESAVDVVVNNVKQLLMEGKLKEGDRLPNEVEISEAMNVSRSSVREAMKILSAFGLVDIRVGNGTYICRKTESTMLDSLLFSFFVNNPNLEKLYELRFLIETDVLECILNHYEENEEERALLKKNLNALKKMMDETPNMEQLKRNDMEFHRLMGKCTKNMLIERIYEIIINFIEASIANTLKNQRGEVAYKEHSQIYRVIDTRSYEEIEKVVTSSVDAWSARQE